jgi:sigma-E factor negative regulatory protein RseC
MEQKARVCAIRDDGTARVSVIRESACSGDCHKCSGCGASKQTVLFDAVNNIGAKTGDLVIIRSETGPVLAGAAVLYMVPLVLFFLGYFLGAQIGMGGLTGCIGFVLGFVLAAVYDRRVTAKRNTVYTITGYAHTKGDHHID